MECCSNPVMEVAMYMHVRGIDFANVPTIQIFYCSDNFSIFDF